MKHLLILATSMLLISCGGNDKGDGQAEELFSDKLIGSWFLECKESISGTYVFSDLEYTGDIVEFENEDCTGGVIEDSSFSAIYYIEGEVQLSDGNIAYEVYIEAMEGNETIELWELIYIDNDRLYSGIESTPENVPTDIDYSSYWEKM